MCLIFKFLPLELSHIIATIVNPCCVLYLLQEQCTIVMILCVKVMI